MKAVYLNKYGNSASAFEIKETEMPIAGKGEVVIRVICFGLNFADVVARRGLYPEAPKNPAILGYDVAGFIHAVGEGVEGLSVGQRVVALTRFGGYAEYAKTNIAGVTVIPDSMDFATATALATQGCTAYFALLRASPCMKAIGFWFKRQQAASVAYWFRWRSIKNALYMELLPLLKWII